MCFLNIVIENDQQVKDINELFGINSLIINGQTNLIFNLRPKKDVDK